jgi:hypothetical protein
MQLTALNYLGAAANPNGVRFIVEDPSGAAATYLLGSSPKVTEVTVGKVYNLTFDAAIAGKWFVRGETLDGGSNAVGVVEAMVIVHSSLLS